MWSGHIRKDTSSNYKEATNLVQRVRTLLEEGTIPKGSELWVFTDNTTAERCYYRGSSKSKELHFIILELRAMEMEGSLIIHFVWIPGTRMIAQGSDALSRGDLSSGVMAGKSFLELLPLNLTAWERRPGLKAEIASWLPGTSWRFTEIKDWFHEVYLDPDGKYIWAPPPALADVALECLCEVKHAYPRTSHCFLCPALFTGRWRKTLGKISDATFSLTTDSVLWPKAECEPLTFGFVCPPLPHSPWRVRRLAETSLWERGVRAAAQAGPRPLPPAGARLPVLQPTHPC